MTEPGYLTHLQVARSLMLQPSHSHGQEQEQEAEQEQEQEGNEEACCAPALSVAPLAQNLAFCSQRRCLDAR